jgi:hypothetical protein
MVERGVGYSVVYGPNARIVSVGDVRIGLTYTQHSYLSI